jgi:hypothetical protein
LHEHALNRARAARGELPVTALWTWGGLPLPVAIGGARDDVMLSTMHLYGYDAYALALCRLRSFTSSDVSGASEAIRTLRAAAGCDTVVLTPGLQQLERHYLANALQAMRERRISSIRVVAYGRSLRLSFAGRLRFWRRALPWWEAFG